MNKGEMNVDPIEGEFFSTEALGSLSDALIREAIQNSLDAAIPGEQVKVVITFSSSDQSLSPLKSEQYLRGLTSHLEAKESGLNHKWVLWIIEWPNGTTLPAHAVEKWNTMNGPRPYCTCAPYLKKQASKIHIFSFVITLFTPSP
jgi:hypothetical protein